MAAAGSSATLYSQLSSIQFSDFTPSRITRPSSNTYLQEHDPLSDLYCAVRTDLSGRKQRSRSDLVCAVGADKRAVALKGKYVDVEFADSYPASERHPRLGPVEVLQEDEVFVGSRAHSHSDPTAVYPLCIRSRVDYKRTAVRRRNQGPLDQSLDVYTLMMDTASFAADGVAERLCNGARNGAHLSTKPTQAPPPLGANKIKIKRRQPFSPPRSSPPPPPRPYGGSFLTRVRLESGAGVPGPSAVGRDPLYTKTVAEVGPESMSPPASTTGYVSLHRREVQAESKDGGRSSGMSTSAFSQLVTEESLSGKGEQDEEENASSADSPSPPRSPPKHRYVNIDEFHTRGRAADVRESDDIRMPDVKESDDIPMPLSQTHRRYIPSPIAIGSTSLPSTTHAVPSPFLQEDSSPPSPLSPSQLPRTKPVPPPRRSFQETLRCLSESRASGSPQSSPKHHMDTRRTRSVSFLQCDVGEEYGRYLADYLGSEQTDSYLNSVDQVAKQLVDSKPVEVVTYVTSEKLRLAPPNNSALLFKSFAMKEILMVQRCSKNKRIIGVVLWKTCSAIPICHVLRCTDQLTANSLYEAIWLQSQSVDDITLNKVRRHQSRPASDISSSSGGSSSTGSELDATSSISTLRDTPVSPTELLHNLPAVHIGSTVAGKLHSVNEVIQKVLSENRPSRAKEVCVWLSLAQVRLVDTSGEEEVIFATHETSRIRAIGVYSLDKRFIGYIIKEEGQPLTGHVLRCNSAALMVSLVSFLRQSCQITFHQRGGSFYDELSADESEDSENSEVYTDRHSPNILRRLRSLTSSAPKPNPSFISHTPLLRQHSDATMDSPPKKRDSIRTPILSPLDFSEEDYARFSVNYVGSATLSPPMSPQSVEEALKLFTNEGVAKGQAAVPKNVIHMQVSSLGINLSDKKHRLFVNRNYPRNQLAGHCIHPQDPQYFAFSSQKPGFPSTIKCHVFRQLHVSTEQIMDAIKFWLELDPISS